ncbi:MAG: Bacterial regulatory protein luxR family [Gammaproteobacteria bacterium]|jgi:DNA-binding CsgD family transcriptional regulator|nr:Bacterial regulatory protein luxR family [Gammaproteobacteria bacterium]
MVNQVPFILSLGYRKQIDEACKGLEELNLKYFVMYIVFNDGSRFVLSNIYHMLVPYYIEGFYKEDYHVKPEIIRSTDHYLCDQANVTSSRFKIMLEERMNVHRAYYIVRDCAECTFIFGAIKGEKFDNYKKIYVNTINDFENFCITFVEKTLNIIKDYNPLYKKAFIFTNPQLLRAVIKRGYPASEDLTEREKECLWWASKGKSIKEVAKILQISPLTAETHNKNIRDKLHCSTIIEAVVEGIHRGMVGRINPMMQQNRFFNPKCFEIVSNMELAQKKISGTNIALINKVNI